MWWIIIGSAVLIAVVAIVIVANHAGLPFTQAQWEGFRKAFGNMRAAACRNVVHEDCREPIPSDQQIALPQNLEVAYTIAEEGDRFVHKVFALEKEPRRSDKRAFALCLKLMELVIPLLNEVSATLPPAPKIQVGPIGPLTHVIVFVLSGQQQQEYARRARQAPLAATAR